MKKRASSNEIQYLRVCQTEVILWGSNGFSICLSGGKEMTLDVFLTVGLAQGVLGWFFPVGKPFALEWHLAWFSHEAQVWTAVCVGRGWKVQIILITFDWLFDWTVPTKFSLVPRVYVCCELKATKNVGF